MYFWDINLFCLCRLVLNVPFVCAVSQFSYRLHIFTTVASMCLFSKYKPKYKHKFWGTKHIYQMTCPPITWWRHHYYSGLCVLVFPRSCRVRFWIPRTPTPCCCELRRWKKCRSALPNLSISLRRSKYGLLFVWHFPDLLKWFPSLLSSPSCFRQCSFWEKLIGCATR